MSNELINPYQKFEDAAGAPLENGTVTFYTNLTTTLATIYSDEALTIAQNNPYTLDAAGRIAGDVKFISTMTLTIKDRLGAFVRTIDNVKNKYDLGDFYTDSGAANAYVLTAVGGTQAPAAYADGQTIRFIPGNANTGASTINVSGLGVKDIRSPNGSVLIGGELQQGLLVSLSYDVGSDKFRLSDQYQASIATVPRTIRSRLTEKLHITDIDPSLANGGDMTAAFNSAIALGITDIYFPVALFTVNAQVDFTHGHMTIHGAGSIQLWALPFPQDVGTIIQLAHTGNGFKLTNTTLSTTNTTSGITFRDISFYGNSNGSRSASCMLWDVGGSALFSRGFRFLHCSFKWFQEVFAFTQSAVTAGNTTQKQIGDIQITDDCSLNFNDAVINTGIPTNSVQINKFRMDHNDISNNTTIGVVNFFSGTIVGNIMEGHADTIELLSCRNFSMHSNHFEGNTGEFIIKVSGDSRNGTAGPNYYGVSTAKRRLWLQSCFDVNPHDPFIFEQMYGAPNVNALKYDTTGASERSFGAAANLARPAINSVNGNVARQVSTNHRRVSGAATVQTDTLLSNERVLLELYATAGTGNYDKGTKALVASTGDYLIVSFLMRRDDTSALEPYIQFKVNDSLDPLKGSWEGPLNNFTKTLLSSNDKDEVLFTVFAKALEPVTDVDIVVYPYGVSPTAGLEARFSGFEYHVSSNIGELQHSLNLEVLNTGDTAPTSGTWARGDTIINRNPSAAGADRWRNVTAGAPGTWKALTLDA